MSAPHLFGERSRIPTAEQGEQGPTNPARTDARLQRGSRTREAILRRAGDIASVEGLEGLTIGRLAAELGVSKSGLFAHFGSKQELQLATVAAAAEVFTQRVVEPALRTGKGIRRVWAMCDSWLEYSRIPVFPGGCFFFAVAAEFDARPGQVRDAIARARWAWMQLYEQVIDQARRLGEITADVDAAQLAFELDALATAANAASQLYDDPSAHDRALRAMLTRLRAVATDPSMLPAGPPALG